jgi:hypothetical protein
MTFDRQIDEKGRSLAYYAFYPDFSIVRLYDFLSNCQAQSGAFFSTCALDARASEQVEHTLLFLSGNTRTFILDCDVYPIFLFGYRNGDIRIRIGKLDCIRDQVIENLFDFCRVDHYFGDVVLATEMYVDLFPLG